MSKIRSIFLVAVLFASIMFIGNYAVEDVRGNTAVSGHISSNTTWTVTGSPYYIEGNLTVDSGATLKMLPGTEVRFNGTYSIFVEGDLSVAGNSTNPVVITSNKSTPSAEDWTSIQINSTGHARVSYANISYAKDGILLESSGNSISNCEIHNTTRGIHLSYSNNNRMENTTLTHNGDGFYMAHSVSNRIINCTFSNNSGNGITAISSSNDNIIEASTFSNNSAEGIYVDTCTGSIIANSTFTKNEYGILFLFSGGTKVWNTSFSNSKWHGIYLIQSDNNVINESKFFNNDMDGIYLSSSTSNTIKNSIFSSNSHYGIRLEHSSDNTVANNTCFNNSIGIYLTSSTSNRLYANAMNGDGIFLAGSRSTFTTQEIPANNTLNGKAVYYYKNINMNNASVPSLAGQVLLGNATYLKIENQIFTNAYVSVEAGYSASISVYNITISNDSEYGFYSNSSTDSLIANSTFSNSTTGIYLDYHSDRTTIMNTLFFYNPDGIHFESSSTNNTIINSTFTHSTEGIIAVSSGGNTIVNSTFTQNDCGILLYSSSGDILDNNICSYNTYGIYAEEGSNYNTITNNTCNNNSWTGIIVPASDGNNITNNICLNNTNRGIYMPFHSTGNLAENNTCAGNSDGIYVFESDSNILRNNTCFNNSQHGIYVYYSNNGEIENNTCENNNYGIYIGRYSYTNLIYHNRIINNTNQAYDYTGSNLWNSSYPTGGNYWSDYTGEDLKSGPGQNLTGSDGIGDTPYTNIGGGSGARDRYPLMKSVSSDTTPPSVISTTPANSSTNIPINQDVVVVFSEGMNTSVTPTLTQTSGTSVTYTFAGWSTTNLANDTATWTHTAWANSETIALNVSGGQDIAGNAQIPYSWNFTTEDPHIATATGPTNTEPSNIAGITITYTYASDTTSVSLYYTTDGGNTWNSIGSDSTIDGSYAWTIPADGTYGWIAVGDDESPPSGGDAPESSSYTYDGTAPTVTGTAPVNGAINVSVSQPVVVNFSEPINTTTFSFTCEPDPGGWSRVWNATDEQVTLTHTSFAFNTTYWINISSANDTAGNTLAGAPYSFNFTTEPTVPPTVVFNSPTGTGVSVSSVITITFNESMNTSSVESAFSINPAVTGTFTWNVTNTTMTFTPSSNLSTGTTYTVRINGSIATDVNDNTLDGNGNGTSEGSPTDDYSWSFTTEVPDTTPPSSSISAISPYWQSSSVTLTLNANDNKALSNITLYYRFSTDNSSWSAWTQYGSPISISGTYWTGTTAFTFPNGDGYYQFYTIATDAANNTETKSTADALCGYDSTPPSVSIDSPSDTAIFNVNHTTVIWIGSDSTSGIDHYDIIVDTQAPVNVGTNTSYTVPNLGDGAHTVMIKAYDRAGNENESAVHFTVDTTIPALRIDSPHEGSLHTGTVEVTWHGSDATTGIDHYEVMLDSNPWIDTGMSTSYTFENLTDGNHSISVKAVDGAGNEAILSVNFTVDATPPTITEHSPTGSDVAVNTPITVTFSEEMDTSTVHITVEGIAGSITWKDNSTVATFTPSHNLSYATEYTVHVTGSDLAGNAMDEYTWSFTTTDIGTITGTVTDENGNPIEGATVTLDTGETTTTDASGHFEIQAHAGNHNLTISKKGYETESTNASVLPGQTVNLPPTKLPGENEPAPCLSALLLLIIILVVIALLIAKVMRERAKEKKREAEILQEEEQSSEEENLEETQGNV